MIHGSNRKISKNNINQIKQITTIKPIGLWYAKDDVWLKFSKKVLEKNYKYLYKVELYYTTFNKPDKNKVLRINTVKDFDKFTFKYGVISEGSIIDFVFIKWDKVSTNYGGIEVTANVKDRRYLESPEVIKKYKKHNLEIKKENHPTSWYYGFDIPSGCVWNPKAIKILKIKYLLLYNQGK